MDEDPKVGSVLAALGSVLWPPGATSCDQNVAVNST